MRGLKLYRKVCEQAAVVRQFVAGVILPIGALDNNQHAGLVKVTLWFVNHNRQNPDRFDPTEHIVSVGDVDARRTCLGSSRCER